MLIKLEPECVFHRQGSDVIADRRLLPAGPVFFGTMLPNSSLADLYAYGWQILESRGAN